jgi:hypothetical protein
MHESMMLTAPVTPDVLAARLSRWQSLLMPTSHHNDIEVQNCARVPFIHSKQLNFPAFLDLVVAPDLNDGGANVIRR